MSTTRNSLERRPSLLAEALDIPFLDHRRDSAGGIDNDGGDHGECDLTETSSNTETPRMSPSQAETTSSNLSLNHPRHIRHMSSFDTPITRNHAIHTISAANFSPKSLNSPQFMKNPYSPLDRQNTQSSSQTLSSNGASSNNILPTGDSLPRHSDFTIPTSNQVYGKGYAGNGTNHFMEPPLVIQSTPSHPNINDGQRRSILGTTVGKKYHCSEIDRSRAVLARTVPVEQEYGSIAPPMAIVDANIEQHLLGDLTPSPAIPVPHHHRRASRMDPKVVPSKEFPDYHYYDGIDGTMDSGNAVGERRSLLSKPSHRSRNTDSPVRKQRHHHIHQHRHSPLHKSIHAQSLLVGLAFMVVWLPNNAMAPNLTQMADSFGMVDSERDLYLGSYCSLALGVFSLPLSGLLGFMADFHSRKNLFLACCGLGGLSAAWSAWSPNYFNLFVSRLCSGGCMSGSVPVAFSFLGDLFSKEERNAASSGLTSMMGLGILLGQIYAGEIGPTKGWQYPFYVSAVIQLIMTIIIAIWVEEPIRGGKEQALQRLLKSGTKYERRLTLDGFIDTMRTNASNWILLWQGFLTSLPWGIVFVFLNDYLSQEKGFSVEEATFLVMLFGVGCAMGGISGGYLGQIFMKGDRSFLPLYMATATFLGIFPFLLLLNSDFANHNGFKSKFYSVLGGCVASLPSVNIRPCIINVNPPESRGAALTTANLFVALGRGIGPCCITLLGSAFNFSRQSSFNITLSFFWTVSAIQLWFLSNTLPRDQDAMEEGLLRYAAAAAAARDGETSSSLEHGNLSSNDDLLSMSPTKASTNSDSAILTPITPNRHCTAGDGGSDSNDEDDDLYMSSPPAQYMTIDGKSARQSFEFIKIGIQELGDEIANRNAYCRGCDSLSPCESNEDLEDSPLALSSGNENDEYDIVVEDSVLEKDDWITDEEMERRRMVWRQQQQQQGQK